MSNGKHGKGKGGPGSHKSARAAISAPYNFVPHASFVFQPEWGRQAGHDRPFRDGVSGEIAYTLAAHTPLLVGGKQKKADEHHAGEVQPYRDPEGRYAIPGSSIKGMLRAVLEIAGFGRMRLVDDRKLSVRDLTGGIPSYQEKMAYKENGAFGSRVHAGWLTLTGAGGQIRPCEYARVEQADLAGVPGSKDDDFWRQVKAGPAAQKYKKWKPSQLNVAFDPGPLQVHEHSMDKKTGRPKQLIYRKAEALGRGSTRGTLVFTGQPSKRISGKPGCKHLEFMFYDAAPEPLPPIDDTVWRGFLEVHQDSKDWEYWRREKRIPVFYLIDDEDNVESLGLAMMYRLPYELGLHDALANTSAEHLAVPGGGEHGYDLADLLFGSLGEDQDYALRGRVSCETARAQGDAKPQWRDATILNGPKPSYYPNYIRQDGNGRGGLRGGTYRTLMDGDAQLRGFKRYPARGRADVQALTDDQQGNTKVQVRLQPLQAGAKFCGRIVFHNLKPAELGALLWVLTWGGNDSLRHGLGMGKPFGFGQVDLAIDAADSTLQPNDPAQVPGALDEAARAHYLQQFTDCMDAACAAESAGPWAETLQITNLLAMAKPAAAGQFEQPSGRELKHMELGRGRGGNLFAEAKKDKQVLANYAVVTGQHEPLPPLPKSGGGARRGKAQASQKQKKAPVPAPDPVAPDSLPASAFQLGRALRDAGNKRLVVVVKGKKYHPGQEREEALLAPLPAALRRDIDACKSTKIRAALEGTHVLALKPR